MTKFSVADGFYSSIQSRQIKKVAKHKFYNKFLDNFTKQCLILLSFCVLNYVYD